MRTAIIKAGLVPFLLLAWAITVNAQNGSFPEIIALPDGFRPEGVTLGYGHQIFAGSLADGSIYQADLRTGEGDILVPSQEGRIAVGLAFDRRSNYLFVAGGPGGTAYVYDAATGEAVADYLLTTDDSFINDVIVTNDAAYFTDSFRPFLYRLPLGAGGRVLGPGVIEDIPLGGDFMFVPGAFNTNGIESTANGKWLVIVHSELGELYRVDPTTGDALLIDLGGDTVVNGDGLVLEGRTLYVVQNRLNQIAVIELTPDLAAGTIEAVITSPYFDVPTTAAGFGNALYAVNARFGVPPEPTPEYEIVRVFK